MTAPVIFSASRFAAMPLIAILRGQRIGVIDPVVQALADGGFIALEITMNTPGATAQIRAAVTRKHLNDRR